MMSFLLTVLKNKNDVIILKEHDVIEYHHIKATVEV